MPLSDYNLYGPLAGTTAPKTTSTTTTYKAPTTTVNEFGSNELWAAMFPNLNTAMTTATGDGYATGSDAWSQYVAGLNSALSSPTLSSASSYESMLAAQRAAADAAAKAQEEARRAAARSAAQALLQMRSRDPYSGLRTALEKSATAAQQTGSSAVEALRAALAARTNPYAGIRFATPTPSMNPLADYMAQSGASTSQVDSLRNLLQSWSANAAAADQQMGDRLSTAWQNDQSSRLADAATTEAAFKQALASNLASQQGQIDAQYAQYQNDVLKQLADLAVSSGMSFSDLGVTI